MEGIASDRGFTTSNKQGLDFYSVYTSSNLENGGDRRVIKAGQVQVQTLYLEFFCFSVVIPHIRLPYGSFKTLQPVIVLIRIKIVE